MKILEGRIIDGEYFDAVVEVDETENLFWGQDVAENLRQAILEVKHLPGRHNQKLHGRTRTLTGNINATVISTVDDAVNINKKTTTIELTGVGSTVALTHVRIYLRKRTVNMPEYGIVGGKWVVEGMVLSDLVAAVADYSVGLGSNAPSGMGADTLLTDQHLMYKDIEKSTQRVVKELEQLSDKIRNFHSDDANDLAVRISMELETYLNANPETAKIVNNALLLEAARFSSTTEFDVFYNNTNELGSKLLSEISAVGNTDDAGLYDLGKLNERFGEFTEDTLTLNRLVIWERLGTIKSALNEYVSGTLARVLLNDILAKAATDPAFRVAFSDYMQFNQWALRNAYGDEIDVYRGLESDEKDELRLAVDSGYFSSLKSFTTSKRVAANFGEMYKITGKIPVSSILASHLTDEKMFRTGELEFLTKDPIPTERFKLVNWDTEDIYEFVKEFMSGKTPKPKEESIPVGQQ